MSSQARAEYISSNEYDLLDSIPDDANRASNTLAYRTYVIRLTNSICDTQRQNGAGDNVAVAVASSSP